MGYVISTNLETGEQEILGDINAAYRDRGLPYYTLTGRYVSQKEIDENDEFGL